MPVNLTERNIVQKPLLKYASQAGWDIIPEQSALNLRKGENGKLFYEILKQSLIKLNPQFLNEQNTENLIQDIENIPDTLEGNKKLLDWIRGQKTVWDEKERRNRNVSFIDFQNLKIIFFKSQKNGLTVITVKQTVLMLCFSSMVSP